MLPGTLTLLSYWHQAGLKAFDQQPERETHKTVTVSDA